MWIESVLCQWCLVIFFGQVFPLKLQIELRGIHWLWKVTHIWSLESVTEAKRRNCLNFLPFHDCLLIIWIWRVRRCAPPVSLDVTKGRQEKKKKRQGQPKSFAHQKLWSHRQIQISEKRCEDIDPQQVHRLPQSPCWLRKIQRSFGASIALKQSPGNSL